MKNSLPILFLVSLACSLFGADKPLVEERFNEASNVDFLNCAEQGPPGSGVSGHVDDRAYVAPRGDSLADRPQPGGLVHAAGMPDQMEKFTVTLWYKADGLPEDPDSLAHFGGLYLLWQTNVGWTMRVEVPPGGKSMSNWYSVKLPGSLKPWSTEGEWIFYAISWNYETKLATIYQGTPADPVVANRTISNFDVTGPLTNKTAPGVIGNNLGNGMHGVGKRPFAGSIDNVRVFQSALEDQDIENIRQADVANKPL